ncbi:MULTISPECIES: DUF4035 domain-containing protein [Pseudoalteromonas]|uniref:Uncharacterized protein n=1 Tax=Pseudoalteromonas amylolytica TaxID=1859457 RepID=A0A1S1MY31_9GAMM|nr:MULTISPECIES: DUF4035 domain-containing protein [Pseudoalteromonas]OHU89162.1 hypothetical protein BFC16_05835 [Pseudoalteromonas sp. JW3]OHU92062.1 hypothetical protein BET10_06940 [Pseudoalteromonas amylolytica]
MNDEQFDNQLRAEFSKQKQQNRLSRAQINQLKTQCTSQKVKPVWPRVQWTFASLAAVFLAYLVFTESQVTQQPLYTLDFEQYQRVEKHTLHAGQYKRSLILQKQQLDNEMQVAKSNLNQAYATHGKLIEKQGDTWFIADCQQQTLLEISTELVAQLTQRSDYQANQIGTLLAFKRNPQGQLVSLSALENSDSTTCS